LAALLHNSGIVQRQANPDMLRGHMMISDNGRFCIAITQYNKGCAFIGAAYLLKSHVDQEAYQSVYLHLLCQGSELIFKGIMLLKDFKKYRSREKTYGHNIVALIEDAHIEFSLKPLRADIKAELDYLANLFSAHALRYAGQQVTFL
jgi:hypothetical protein